jgi:hypothetical protein
VYHQILYIHFKNIYSDTTYVNVCITEYSVSERGVTLPGSSEVSVATATLCDLLQCTVFGDQLDNTIFCAL